MNQPKKTRKKSSATNPLVFKLIVIAIPFIILFSVEGILRVANYGDNLDLFVQNETKGYEKFMMVNPVIGKKYFQKFEHTAPPNDIFYTEKPANTFRVFVMGSSTVYGFPYDRNLMFSRILNKQLADIYPEKKIEVVNTAITAINSYSLLDYVDEIIKYEPDAILIYAGHNEFYGAFGIGSNETMSRNSRLTQLHISLMKVRLYQLLRNTISWVAGTFVSNTDEVHGTLMKRMVGNADILYGSDEYEVAMQRYRKNMGKILSKFQQKNIPVFLSDVVSNVKGIEPFNSIANDSLPAAIDIYNEAKVAEKNQDFEKASQLYYYAKDLDCIRFRASEDVNEIIDDLAKGEGIFKVPMLEWFKKNSENELIGDNLMTEHVHPNINGIFLMAQAFLDEIIDAGIIGSADKSQIHSYQYYKRNWGYSTLDSLSAVHRVNSLKGFWPFIKLNENEYYYLQVYQPKNKLDSIVISVLRDSDEMLSLARLDLAREYQKEGKIELAYKEFDALLRTNPYVAINYRDAANCLIMLGDIPLALKYFKKSLEYENSFLANYRIGEIYMLKSDFENAEYYLRKSFDLAPDENKANVLGKMYITYIYSGKMEEAKLIDEELQKINASIASSIQPKRYVYNQYVPYQTKEKVLKARSLANEMKYTEAVTILKKSLEIYDSHIAKRFLGEIYFEQNNFENTLTYFKNIYEEFKFDPFFLDHLTLTYFNLNDKSNAQKYFHELRLIEPNYKELNKISELISSM